MATEIASQLARYGVRTSSGWLSQDVEVGGVGSSPSIAVDSMGAPHIVYTDYLGGAVHYAH